MKKAALETSREKSDAIAEQQEVVCANQFLPWRIQDVCCKEADTYITSRISRPPVLLKKWLHVGSRVQTNISVTGHDPNLVSLNLNSHTLSLKFTTYSILPSPLQLGFWTQFSSSET
jgi:hypothetical protein